MKNERERQSESGKEWERVIHVVIERENGWIERESFGITLFVSYQFD